MCLRLNLIANSVIMYVQIFYMCKDDGIMNSSRLRNRGLCFEESLEVFLSVLVKADTCLAPFLNNYNEEFLDFFFD